MSDTPDPLEGIDLDKIDRELMELEEALEEAVPEDWFKVQLYRKEARALLRAARQVEERVSWRCTSCGEAYKPDGGWRHGFRGPEHRCEGVHPQAGHQPARYVGDPLMASVLAQYEADLAREHRRAQEAVQHEHDALARAERAQAERDAYEEVLADSRRVTRELDVVLCGDGAAPDPALIDVMASAKRVVAERDAALKRAEDAERRAEKLSCVRDELRQAETEANKLALLLTKMGSERDHLRSRLSALERENAELREKARLQEAAVLELKQDVKAIMEWVCHWHTCPAYSEERSDCACGLREMRARPGVRAVMQPEEKL